MAQQSHPYMTTGKTIALTRQTFVSKVMSLLFNMLPRLVLPRSKHLLISWLHSPSAVILEPPKIKPATVSPPICHEVIGLLCPWDSPGKNTGVDCHFLLQGILPTQGSNLHLWHRLRWQVSSLLLCHLGNQTKCLYMWFLMMKMPLWRGRIY